MAEGIGVTKQHVDYTASLVAWKRIRDACGGEDAIKKARTTYLPMLGGQSERGAGTGTSDDEGDYDGYLKRAVWYGASGRTVVGLLGALFRKPPQVELPKASERAQDNVDLAGTPVETFLRHATEEVLKMGRYGILVDAPTTGAAGAQTTPYLIGWTAEQITNWRVVIKNGKTILDQVILRENVHTASADGFGADESDRYRVHELDENGQYQVRVFEIDSNGKAIQQTGAFTPRMRSKRLDFVPFVFLGATNLLPNIDKSPILELVNMNIAHYLNSADLEWGRHFTALPTPYVITPDQRKKWPLGPTVVWDLPLGSSVGMLEFSGQGLATLERAMEEKERKMALLGARLLEESKRAAEAAETLKLRQAGESGTLATVGDNVSDGATKALGWLTEWAGGDPKTAIAKLNKDFIGAGLSPEGAFKLMQIWHQGGISQETFLYILKAGELLPPGRTIEEEMELIEEAQRTQNILNDQGGGEGEGAEE